MKKKLKRLLRSALRTDGKPEDIALAFAIGVFVAFFPVLGVHTIMALGLAWLFGVSPAIALAGTFVNNPWTFVLVYGGGLYTGLIVMGMSIAEVSIDWSNLNSGMLVELAKQLIVPFVVGCLLLGVAGAIAGYVFMLKAVLVYRRRAKTGLGGG